MRKESRRTSLRYLIEGEEHGFTSILLSMVPTGIVSVELAQVSRPVSTQPCPACGRQGNDVDVTHCKHCGAGL